MKYISLDYKNYENNLVKRSRYNIYHQLDSLPLGDGNFSTHYFRNLMKMKMNRREEMLGLSFYFSTMLLFTFL